LMNSVVPGSGVPTVPMATRAVSASASPVCRVRVWSERETSIRKRWRLSVASARLIQAVWPAGTVGSPPRAPAPPLLAHHHGHDLAADLPADPEGLDRRRVVVRRLPHAHVIGARGHQDSVVDAVVRLIRRRVLVARWQRDLGLVR